MSFGRFHGAITAVLYRVTNPLWVGGSLAFIACEAWAATDLPALQINELGSFGDYAFKHGVEGFAVGDAHVVPVDLPGGRQAAVRSR